LRERHVLKEYPRRKDTCSFVSVFARPFGGLSLVALAVMLLAMPASLEGPELVPISPGHALSVLDSIALAPLLLGTALLYGGLWRRRGRLWEFVRLRPVVGGAKLFFAGLGLGLLLASAFSSFFWRWAFGAALFAAMTLAVLIVVR
jgi:hypothetical protein